MENSLIALANQSVTESGIKKTVKPSEKNSDKDIAIIGMAGRIGDSDNLTDFFQKVLEEYDFIVDLPENRKKDADEALEAFYPDANHSNVKYVKGGYLKNVDLFDYEFFGMPYIEMETMDPTQRAIFEAAIQSIWHAGYTEKQLNNSKTGVFIGNSNTAMETYKQLLMKYDDSLRDVALAGNLNSVLSSRISYYLNLKGSSMVIDTACSSGLVALHTACEEL
jgi:acyl transferase domain-containing protein